MIYPTHLQIEPVNGICTARCTMCAFPSWTRKPHIMSLDTFTAILKAYLPYRDHLQYLSLQGFGETLMDRGIAAKIKVAKSMGYPSVGFATNCTELGIWTSHALLSAGLDTLICSVDGVTKATHEAIRVGTNYDKVVENITNFMAIRSRLQFNTKVIIRFIRQKLNAHEWERFKARWEKQFDPNYGDAVVSFDVVDCENKVDKYEDKDVLQGVRVPMVCDQINSRMIVLSNGDVALCCADDNGRFGIGNVLEYDPAELYNNSLFSRYRRMMADGMIERLNMCKGCTIPRSEERKDRV